MGDPESLDVLFFVTLAHFLMGAYYMHGYVFFLITYFCTNIFFWAWRACTIPNSKDTFASSYYSQWFQSSILIVDIATTRRIGLGDDSGKII